VERSRLWLMLLGVLLTAASTALAGPISFVALLAPQIARRLCGVNSATSSSDSSSTVTTGGVFAQVMPLSEPALHSVLPR
jgi:ABC-type enterobactin transport system permease subunit